MATTSFYKDFVLKDPSDIARFKKALADTAAPKTVIQPVDIKAETKKGIELLKRSLLQ